MHDNGTAKQADNRMSNAVISQAVRGNSDFPARAWGAASTRDVAASAPAPASATTPAERGGCRHSRPLGSYESCMPGGTDGRTGTAGRRPVEPGIAGAAGAITAFGVVAAVDGCPAGAGDGARRGRWGASTGTALSQPKGM